jgi:NAD(P)-dependent dehydrogenase (short-subunit alcohol dehydrogenase family)
MKKVAVVGASTGLGRCIAAGLAQRGDKLALLARSQDKLQAAAAEAGNGAVGIVCDATDEASAKAGIEQAAAALGGIDTVIYAAAVGPLTRLRDTDSATWRWAFDTNVLGAALITSAAIPHLTRSAGSMLYMSTTGASYTPPWPGLGVYQVTKAAMDRMVESFRAEQAGINFTRVTIGECPGGEGDNQTQFNAGWDMSLIGEFAGEWISRGYMNMAFIDIAHLIDVFHTLVHAGPSMQVPSITVIPRPALPAGA